jgi:hypothetical protein
MICVYTGPIGLIYLAGYSGRQSETQGLNLSIAVNSQLVNYVNTSQSRNYWRPGSLVNASFNSSVSFSNVDDAEDFIASIPYMLSNQTNATVLFGELESEGSKQVVTYTASNSAKTKVTLSGQSGSTIYYTTDGSTPDNTSVAASPGDVVWVDVPSTFKAIGTQSGFNDSQVIEADFVASTTVSQPTFSPDSGDYSGASVTVAITCETSGSTIYYTTDGSAPTTGSPTISSGSTVSVPNPGTLKAYAVKSGLTDSPVKTATYVVEVINTSPIVSGGTSGTYTVSGTTYKYHKFTSNGTLTVSKAGTIEYLVVGGGGAGGCKSASNGNGGGGGAGGVLQGSIVIPAGIYEITVGTGGAANPDFPNGLWTPALFQYHNGKDSSIGSLLTAKGGGAGASPGPTFNPTALGSSRGLDGGSGGGGSAVSYTSGSTTYQIQAGSGLETSAQGNKGGGQQVSGTYGVSGSGGGAGTEGAMQTSSTANIAGGSGASSSIDNVATIYAEGGGIYSTISGRAANSGSGGHGSRTLDIQGGAGASGIVIIRYVEDTSTVYCDTPSFTPNGGQTPEQTHNAIFKRFGENIIIPVQVKGGDTATQWATKVAIAMQSNQIVSANHVITNPLNTLIRSESVYNENDPAQDLDMPSGFGGSISTTYTTNGAADTITERIKIFDSIVQVSASHRGATVGLSVTISGRTDDPNA